MILSRIAHSHEIFHWRYAIGSSAPAGEVSNLDQLIFRFCLIMDQETSTSSLSFRSSELSQLSEAFSS